MPFPHYSVVQCFNVNHFPHCQSSRTELFPVASRLSAVNTSRIESWDVPGLRGGEIDNCSLTMPKW
jgi:hypothetical protein